MNKTSEYICIITATILHGIITYFVLGSMPHISFIYFHKTSIIAFCMWAVYGTLLSFTAQKLQKPKLHIKHFLLAFLFGIGTAISKGLLDFIIAKLIINIDKVMVVAVIDGLVNLIFGVLLIILTRLFFTKTKIVWKTGNSTIALSFVIITIALYAFILSFYFIQNNRTIEKISATYEEIQNLDYYFAFKITDMNVLFYVLLYILFWWFSDIITSENT